DAIARPNTGSVHEAVGVHLGVGTDAAVFQDTVRPDPHAVRELDLPDHDHVHIDEDVATGRHLAAHIDASGVRDGDAIQHELVRFLRSVCTLERSKLHFVVDA